MPFCNLLLDTISCFPHPYGILLFFRDYFYQLFEFCFSLIYVFCSSFSLLVLGASGLTRLRQNVPLGGAPSGRCARGPEGGPLRVAPKGQLKSVLGGLSIGGLGPQSVPGKPAGIRGQSKKAPLGPKWGQAFDLWSKVQAKTRRITTCNFPNHVVI